MLVIYHKKWDIIINMKDSVNMIFLLLINLINNVGKIINLFNDDMRIIYCKIKIGIIPQ